MVTVIVVTQNGKRQAVFSSQSNDMLFQRNVILGYSIYFIKYTGAPLWSRKKGGSNSKKKNIVTFSYLKNEQLIQ